MPKVITANHLLEGDVIYLTAARDWTRTLNEAVVATTDEEANALLAFAETQADMLVGAYLMDVVVDGIIATKHFREEFRTKGPSNYFHGKQEVANV